jgi:hypothetical protein
VHLLGKVGVPLSTLLFFLSVCALSFHFVKKETGIRIRVGDTFLRPALCALLSALSALFAFPLLARRWSFDLSLIIAILVAVLVYAFALLFTRAVSKRLVQKLPFGEKILGKFERFFSS